MIDFTTVVSIDEAHLKELYITWPTWVKYRPEILTKPLLVYFDRKMPADKLADLHDLFSVVKNLMLIPVKMRSIVHRENMLAPFVLDAPFAVQTPWLLKLDVDTIAMRADPNWCSDQIVAPQHKGNAPVLAAHRWGYTKPGRWILELDKWAASIPTLANQPPLNLRQAPGSMIISHPRFTSWCFFGRVDWCRTIAGLCGFKLPVPSHDTYTWYCAARQGAAMNCCIMKAYGWDHLTYRGLKAVRDRQGHGN